MSCADLNIFPPFPPRNSSVQEEEKKTTFLNCGRAVPPCFITSEIIQQTTDWLYTLRSSSQQKAGAAWGHYRRPLPVWLFYFTTVVLIFCFSWQPFRKRLVSLRLVLENKNGGETHVGVTVSPAKRFSIKYSLLVFTSQTTSVSSDDHEKKNKNKLQC